VEPILLGGNLALRLIVEVVVVELVEVVEEESYWALLRVEVVVTV